MGNLLHNQTAFKMNYNAFLKCCVYSSGDYKKFGYAIQKTSRSSLGQLWKAAHVPFRLPRTDYLSVGLAEAATWGDFRCVTASAQACLSFRCRRKLRITVVKIIFAFFLFSCFLHLTPHSVCTWEFLHQASVKMGVYNRQWSEQEV